MTKPIVLACLATAFMAQALPIHAQSAELPAPDATALWEYLEKQDYRKSFQLFPGKGEFYEGVNRHGPLLTTYVNDTAAKALVTTDSALPAGSILVKEVYGPDKTHKSTAVMYKVAGYAPEDGDWFWLERSPDGLIEEEGKVESCTRCHYKGLQGYILTPVKK